MDLKEIGEGYMTWREEREKRNAVIILLSQKLLKSKEYSVKDRGSEGPQVRNVNSVLPLAAPEGPYGLRTCPGERHLPWLTPSYYSKEFVMAGP